MTRYLIRTQPTARRRVDLDQLNPQQREVVVCEGGPLLVIAGAGSGKTRTLTHRAAYLIDRGVDPRRLLLCTFTNRAAREMLRRVESLLGTELRPMWAGTFHHIGNLVLRRYGGLLGLPENYTILDREDARDLVGACLAEEGKRLRQRRFPKPSLLQHLASMSINCELSLADTLTRFAPRFYELTDDVSRILDRYVTRKLQLGLVDYDDLLLMFKMVLVEHPEAGEALAERFEHVLVDEYQDTNRLQGEIVDLCARHHKNLTVVGDDAQSIYSFRGAHFKNIIDFPRRYPGARVFKLEVNYRSTPEVLELANASIANNRHQFPKVLRPVRPAGPKPALLPLHDVYQQAAFVAQRVLELSQQEGVPLSQLAVLYRAHSHSLELQLELGRRKIPFSVRSGLRFLEQAHIKDVLAYLRLTHNGRDALAWQRVMKLWAGVGLRSAERVAQLAGEQQQSSAAELLADEALIESLPPGARASVRKLAELMLQLDPNAPPGSLISAVVQSHYAAYAETAFPNAETRIEDLQQLASLADRFETVEQLLSELALVAGVGAETVEAQERPDEKLTLSTIHQAKGLEWRAVFVLWLSEGRFPQAIAIRTAAEIEEERRLFYVAATRAMDQLYLCHPGIDEGRDGSRRLLRLSRFVGELPQSRPPYERWEIEEAVELPSGIDRDTGNEDDERAV